MEMPMSSNGARVDLQKWLSDAGEAVNQALTETLNGNGADHSRLAESMRYSTLKGGKRFRPALVLLSCEACGGRREDALPAAVAIELIHAFSMIHDDLPGMDDDDYRRGQPTNHKVYGEGMAILAGDALVMLAFQTLADRLDDARKACRVISELSDAAGWGGMIAGQADDIDGAGQEADEEQVRRIHRLKTARLISAATRSGAIVSDADDAMIEAMSTYGERLGLAFQIVDDLLDVVGVEETVGKTLRKDEKSRKITYPGVVGVERARGMASQLVDEACQTVEGFGAAGRLMSELARFGLNRTH
jgi:geranylgeranyl diphosphate synthase type II